MDNLHLYIQYLNFHSHCNIYLDDLFDDNDSLKPTKKEENNKDETNKRKYLDQKWKLNAEDAKDFKGFPKNDAIAASTATVNPVDAANSPIPQVPVFALMYKFRKEYLDTTVESMMADHKGHCSKFKRLLSSEFINIGKAKGVVSLWAGFTEVDKAETKADIMSFLEEDPLIVKDVVENWDIIDFTQGSEKDLKVVAA